MKCWWQKAVDLWSMRYMGKLCILLFNITTIISYIYLFIWDRVLLWCSGQSSIHCVAQASVELSDPPATVFWVLGLQVCITISGYKTAFKRTSPLKKSQSKGNEDISKIKEKVYVNVINSVKNGRNSNVLWGTNTCTRCNSIY